MTEYGRSPGSQPWHPEDPLYGDQGWGGQQPGDPYYQQQPQYGAGQQDPYRQSYGDQQQYGTGGQEYGSGAPGQQYGGGWDTGTGQHAAMPYGTPPPPADPYGTGQGSDLYSTPEAYPPPQPPGQRPAEPHDRAQAQAQPQQGRPDPGAADWQAEADDDHHAFFDGPGDDGRPDDDPADDGYDDGYDDEPADTRRGARDRRGRTKKRKSRNGVACLFVAVVLAGGLGGVGYYGYQFWQDRFGPAPDFTGSGTGEGVTVEIPKNAFGSEIGSILLKAGVVKSADAFIAAQERNPKGQTIQPGFYTLQKGMSGDAAVEAMLSPKSRNVLIIPEGKRNSWVYEQIDKRLELAPGTTKKVAKDQAKNFGLPDWATGHANVKDPLEGFLFPADYPVAKGNKPEEVLKRMVDRANAEYGKLDLDAKAKSLGLKGPWELVTVASLVQVEGKYKHDFDKVARVVYNRLKPDNVETVGRLEFDSTVNYLKGESTLDVGTVADLRKIKDPYNTYDIKGLTPGPISNPGTDALASAMDPTPGPWYYFVSINEDKTVFSVTNEEHNKNVAEYEKERARSGQ
ncbi:endolytic transglycosylase MltG [Streptomyces sp. TRM49041]|uniref:endolytic transglycosylase MltG n=1 Tax=Streptomyces sp. TRM49041 TaxID=2603216 RepID=UPI0011EC1649|nr:endolytic transglycosylase MltG [Streptomyces sp. TRM49041]